MSLPASSKRRVVEHIGKGNRRSSWREPRENVNFAAMYMGFIPGQSTSPLIPPHEGRCNRDKNGIVTRIRGNPKLSSATTMIQEKIEIIL